jgi:hypothetical protein
MPASSGAFGPLRPGLHTRVGQQRLGAARFKILNEGLRPIRRCVHTLDAGLLHFGLYLFVTDVSFHTSFL